MTTSNSQHRALREYVVALLLAGTAMCSGAVFGQRAYPLPTGRAAQIHVTIEQSEPEIGILTGAPVDWTTTLQLQVLARAIDGTAAEDLADQLWTEAYARIAADATLGGSVQMFTPQSMYLDQDEADTAVVRLTWSFTVQHRTASNTIT